MARRCHWPPESSTPPNHSRASSVFQPLRRPWTTSAAPERSAARWSDSRASPRGWPRVMFSSAVSGQWAKTCGTTAVCLYIAYGSSVRTSRASQVTVPPVGR